MGACQSSSDSGFPQIPEEAAGRVVDLTELFALLFPQSATAKSGKSPKTAPGTAQADQPAADHSARPQQRLPCLLVAGAPQQKKQPQPAEARVQEAFAEKPSEKLGDSKELGLRVGVTCQKGLKKDTSMPNQDHYVIFQAHDTSIYGVFDGHGPNGHDVSSFAASRLVQHMLVDAHFKINDKLASVLAEAFVKTHGDCAMKHKKKKMDCQLSGTTATVLVERQCKGIRANSTKLVMAHVGDSRAVLGSRSKDGSLKATDLTMDHKLSLEAERRRITDAGGVIRKLEENDPNERLYMKNSMRPGLTMSRSLGDLMAAGIGVSCQPDVVNHKVEKGWEFVLLCSDGIWEFISSQEAVEIIGAYPPNQVQTAVLVLAEQARQRWQKEEQTVDDITAICVWLVDRVEEVSVASTI